MTKDQQTPECESQSAFARRLGLSRQYIGRLVANGMPVTQDRQVRTEEAMEWIRQNVHRQDGSGQGATLTDAQTQLVLVKTEIAAEQLRKARGELIDRRVAKLAVANLMRMVREGLMNFGSRHGPDIAAKVDCKPSDLVAAIDAAMRDTLQDLTADRNLPDDFE